LQPPVKSNEHLAGKSGLEQLPRTRQDEGKIKNNNSAMATARNIKLKGMGIDSCLLHESQLNGISEMARDK